MKTNESLFIKNKEKFPEISDVLAQIKKKSEEISTSDASTKLLKNISNPTNLTNPQIIISRNKNNYIFNNYKYHLPSLKKSKMTFSDSNIKKFSKNTKSETTLTSINQFSTIDPFDLNNYHKLIEKVDFEIFQNKIKEKPKNKIILEKINKNLLIDNYSSNFSKDNKNIFPHKIYLSQNTSQTSEIDNVKTKSKKKRYILTSNRVKGKKNIEFIHKMNLIKLLKINNKNKNERYNHYLSIQNSQIKTTDNTIKKLKNSIDYLEKKYNEEYVSYIQFLGQESEKGKKFIIELINEKEKKIFEVSKLQNRINKMIKIKKNLIRWLYLQIQVKENLSIVPEYYENIIEDNISYDELKRKYNIDLNEYKRIINYRGKNIYDDAREFFSKIEDLENNSLSKLNINLNRINEDKIIIEKYNKLKEFYINQAKEDNKKLNNMIYEFKKVKIYNIELKKKLIKAKLEKNYKKKSKDKSLINKLSMYSNINSNEKGNNIILKNEKSSLFYLILCLYYIVSLNKFKELENKKLILDFFKSDETIILEILEYAENIINLLLSQKKYYYSNPELKNKYKEIAEEMDKKTKLEKILMNIKMQKQKENEKKEKLNEKLNKIYIKQKRKYDYDYYRKEINKKKIKIMMMHKSIKNETKFEDFLYDIYS